MKMSRFEKLFVNSDRQSRRTARHAERLLHLVGPPTGALYLEVGCGNGATTLRVAEAFGLDAVGVDVDPEQVRLARERAGSRVQFQAGDATALAFEAEAFDIVLCLKTTHHIPDWLAALREMDRVLKPGGHLVYFDFVLPAPLAALAKALTSSAGFPTLRGLEGFAHQAGFGAVHLSASGFHYEAVWRKAALL